MSDWGPYFVASGVALAIAFVLIMFLKIAADRDWCEQRGWQFVSFHYSRACTDQDGFVRTIKR